MLRIFILLYEACSLVRGIVCAPDPTQILSLYCTDFVQLNDAARRLTTIGRRLHRTSLVRFLDPYCTCLPFRRGSLSAGQTALCHGSVLLLEPVTKALRALHVLVNASHHAALFARREGLALEAVDAGVEALLDEVGVHLSPSVGIRSGACINSRWHAARLHSTYVHEFLHLLLLHAVLELALLVLCKPARGQLPESRSHWWWAHTDP